MPVPTVNGATDRLNQVNTQLLCNSVTLNCCTLLFVGLVRNVSGGGIFVWLLFFSHWGRTSSLSQHALKAFKACQLAWFSLVLKIYPLRVQQEAAMASGNYIPPISGLTCFSSPSPATTSQFNSSPPLKITKFLCIHRFKWSGQSMNGDIIVFGLLEFIFLLQVCLIMYICQFTVNPLVIISDRSFQRVASYMWSWELGSSRTRRTPWAGAVS